MRLVDRSKHSVNLPESTSILGSFISFPGRTSRPIRACFFLSVSNIPLTFLVDAQLSFRFLATICNATSVKTPSFQECLTAPHVLNGDGGQETA